MKPREIILRPVITEKTTHMQERENSVCFEVDRRANKIEIRKAVEQLFGVRVVDVHVLNRRGKPVMRWGRVVNHRPAACKAYVKLAPGSRPSSSSRALRSSRWPFAATSRPRRGRRFVTAADFSELTSERPEKRLVHGIKRSSGRNAEGHITSRHRGRGHKRLYRIIDFKRNKLAVVAGGDDRVRPEPSACIAVLHYTDGDKRYILAPVGLKGRRSRWSGRQVESARPTRRRCARSARNLVHNVELKLARVGSLRSGVGAFCPAHRQGRHLSSAAHVPGESAQVDARRVTRRSARWATSIRQTSGARQGRA